MLQSASEVPIVRDAHYFVCADEERLTAMQEAQRATTDEARLEATLLVTNLYQQQITALNDDVLPDMRQLDDSDDEVRIDDVKPWLDDWLEEAGVSLQQWSDYQDGLVAQVGTERAQEIAQGTPSDRLQAVIDAAKKRVLDDARASGLDVSALEEERPDAPDTKTCPDCAEEVKAAARKCRFCGFRFDEAEGA